MVAVALISAFITMRFAIHGREAIVPALTGLTAAEAGKTAGYQGLNLTLENHFYSSEIPAGRILAQDPAPGSRVRREWPVRITESLGPQRVNIPDLTGESERAATVSIRRLSLDLGSIAHLPAPGDSDIVLTQTPMVNSAGVDGPRVSLLVSDPESTSDSSSDASLATAYVMPSLTGLSYYAAAQRAVSAGLRVVISSPQPASPPTSQSSTATPNSAGLATSPAPGSLLGSAEPSGSSIVVAQTPQPGRRVTRGDAVHVTLAHPFSVGAVSSQ